MQKVISRAEAKALGLKRYFTGKPCRNGHISEREYCRGCIQCLIESREYHREYNRKWHRENYEPNPRAPSIRQLAERAGLKRYFTGEPCINGHVCERYTRDARCIECENARQRARKKRRKEEDPKGWQEKNREKRRKQKQHDLSQLDRSTGPRSVLPLSEEERAMRKAVSAEIHNLNSKERRKKERIAYAVLRELGIQF